MSRSRWPQTTENAIGDTSGINLNTSKLGFGTSKVDDIVLSG